MGGRGPGLWRTHCGAEWAQTADSGSAGSGSVSLRCGRGTVRQQAGADPGVR